MVQDCEPTRAGRAQALALGDARAWQAPIARAAAPITRSLILRAHATFKNTLSKRAENGKRSLRSVDLMFIICKFLHVIGSIMACALQQVLNHQDMMDERAFYKRNCHIEYYKLLMQDLLNKFQIS